MQSTTKKSVFALIMILFLVGIIEGIAWTGLWWLEKNREIEYDPMEFKKMPSHQRKAIDRLINNKTRTTEFSRSLGWQPKQSVNVSEGRFITNSIRIRHDREFAPKLPTDKVRISTFGDSFTAGIGVANSETWQEQMMASNKNLEVLNFGVGAYGPDQAYLRYLENPLSQHIVAMGYLTENLHRVISVYVPFYAGRNAHIPVTKPRFLIENDELVLVPNPIQNKEGYTDLVTEYEQALRRFGKHDNYYNERYRASFFDFLGSVRLGKIAYYNFKDIPIYNQRGEYNIESDAFRVTTGVFEAFREKVLAEGALPVVVVFPTYPNVVYQHRHKQKKYRSLIQWLDKNGYVYLDLMDGLLGNLGDNKIIDMFLKDLHYGPLGHQLVAKNLLAFIAEHKLEEPETRARLIAEMKK